VYRALGGGWEIREGQELVPPDIRAEMEKRTNWATCWPRRPTICQPRVSPNPLRGYRIGDLNQDLGGNDNDGLRKKRDLSSDERTPGLARGSHALRVRPGCGEKPKQQPRLLQR